MRALTLNKHFVATLSAAVLITAATVSLNAYEAILTTEELEGQLEKSRLDEVFEKYLATIQVYDPERATTLGIHDFDHNLTDRSQDRINKELDAISVLRGELKNIRKNMLPTSSRMDLESLDRIMEVDIHDLEKRQLSSKRPQYYLEPVYLIYNMLSNDYMPISLRGSSALERLRKLPALLKQAEGSISRPPKEWTEQAIKQARHLSEYLSIGIFNEYLRESDAGTTTLNNTEEEETNRDKPEESEVLRSVKYTVNLATSALVRYSNFLEKDVLPVSNGDMAIGDYEYGFYLERMHSLNMTSRKAHSLSQKYYEQALRDIKIEARGIDLVRAGRRGWKEVLKKLYPNCKVKGECPLDRDIIPSLLAKADNAKLFFDESKVISYPRQRIMVKEMQYFMTAAYPVVYYQPPFALEDNNNRISQIFVLLPRQTWSSAEREAYVSNVFNYSQLELLTAFYMIPGMHVHNAESSKHQSRIRRISKQPIVTNGWAAYSEYLAEEQGFYEEPNTRFFRYYNRLIRAARSLVDTSMHTKRWTPQQASEFLQEELSFTKERADEEVLKISLTPTEAFSYVYGMQRIIQMRDYYVRTEAKLFDLRKFHDLFLSLGEIPIDLIEEEVKLMKKDDRRIIR